LSSLTNFALVIVIARTTTPGDFGGYAIVLAIYFVAVGLGQAIVSQPLAVRHSASSGDALRQALPKSLGAALVVGITLGAACLVVGLVSPLKVGAPLIVLGLALPGLILQDALRFSFVISGNPRSAVANDGFWAAMQVLGFAVLFVTNAGALWFLAVWGLAGGLSAVWGSLQLKVAPDVTATPGWIRLHRGLVVRYTLESLVVRGSMQATLGVVGLVLGLPAIGAVRGAQVLFSPLNLVHQGAFLVAVPETVRTLRRHAGQFRRAIVAVSGVTAALTAMWALPLLIIPSWSGREVLGQTWDSAHPLILGIGLQYVAIGLTLGPQIGLRALGAAGASLRANIAGACVVLAATMIGASVGGTQGAVAGIAIGTLLSVAIWGAFFWIRFTRRAAIGADSESLEGAIPRQIV
jgi:O-antigen/teichoic acid export membrane protein